MNRFKVAAVLVLKEQKKPLHYRDITSFALQKDLLRTEGKTPCYDIL